MPTPAPLYSLIRGSEPGRRLLVPFPRETGRRPLRGHRDEPDQHPLGVGPRRVGTAIPDADPVAPQFDRLAVPLDAVGPLPFDGEGEPPRLLSGVNPERGELLFPLARPVVQAAEQE